ncbi:hypothetical protein VYU27_007302 [Nannochloropsis oceanica]
MEASTPTQGQVPHRPSLSSEPTPPGSPNSSVGVGGSIVVASSLLLVSSLTLWQAWHQHQQTPLATTGNAVNTAKLLLPVLGVLASLSFLCYTSLFSSAQSQSSCDEPDTKITLGQKSTDSSFSPSTTTTSSQLPSSSISNAEMLFRSGGVGGNRIPPRQAPSAGQTIIVVGAGTAGAAAAVGLAERGFKVLLFERDMTLQDRIVGELLQPGGVRALERLGLDECAKEGIDSVGVEGYVVFRPHKLEVEGGEEEVVKNIMLNYPAYDPASMKELFGVIDPCVSPSSSSSSSSSSLFSIPPSTEEVHGAGKTLSPHSITKARKTAGAVATAATTVAQEHEPLRPKGRSFHNGRFVQRLRERALAEKNVTVIQGIVSRLVHEEDLTEGAKEGREKGKKQRVVGVEYKIETGRTLTNEEGVEVPEKETRRALAPLTIVADGLWSSLRTHVDKCAKPHQLSSFVGLIITHPFMSSPLPHAHCGHVVLAEPSPVLLYQISSTETRVLVDIHGKLPSASTGELASHLYTHILPQLPPCLQAPFAEAVARGNFKSMPNRAMPAAKLAKDGVILLGDALNMRHPLTGGGMTVALRDVEALCYLLEEPTADLTNPVAFRALKKRFATERKSWAATINVLANALHAVFSTPDGDLTRKDLRDACFDYLSIGGYCAGGPINLLSGLTPRPSILAMHFFLVAFHGVGKYVWPFPTLGGMVRMYDMLHVACQIIMPLLTVEGSTVLASWPVRTAIGVVFPYGK